MTPVDLSVLTPADRELVDEALRILGGEVTTITTSLATQAMLPMAGMAAPKKKTRLRKGKR
jgi:hypothetical protein